MERRTFIQSAMAAGIYTALPWSIYGQSSLNDIDVKIAKIVAFRVKYNRPRIVGGNSKYKLAGGTRHDWMIALFAENGMIGIGSAPKYGKPEPSNFPLGKTVGDLLGKYRKQTAETIGTTAVWDLAGKVQKKPVYELLGGKANTNGVQVYDGGIYMEELVNRDINSPYRSENAPYGNRPDWQDVFKEAIDISQSEGHNFVKVKIGRGDLHLAREAGNMQDAAVLRFIRDYAGKDLKIGVDANDAYTLKDTKWLLKEHGDINLEFIEEMFPEDIQSYAEVKALIKGLGLSTHIADGENWQTPQEGKPFIESGTIDVLQGDMRMFQIEGILEEAKMSQKVGSLIAPHNWGCEFAWCVMIHMGHVIPNYYGAEKDNGIIDIPIYTGEEYKVVNGRCIAPNAPGFGLELKSELLNKVEIIYQFES